MSIFLKTTYLHVQDREVLVYYLFTVKEKIDKKRIDAL